jgi:hypothetical protein
VTERNRNSGPIAGGPAGGEPVEPDRTQSEVRGAACGVRKPGRRDESRRTGLKKVRGAECEVLRQRRRGAKGEAEAAKSQRTGRPKGAACGMPFDRARGPERSQRATCESLGGPDDSKQCGVRSAEYEVRKAKISQFDL